MLPDGTQRHVHGEVEITFGDDKKPIKITGTTQDVTDRHVAQMALESAKQDAEFANRAKSEFLSSMSHELRTPMNAVLGYAQLLLQNKKETLTERQQKQVTQILDSGRHLLQLINDILNLSKVESGQFTIDFEDFDPAKTIQESIALISSQAERNNITMIDSTANKEVPEIRADHMRLKQALLNLLSNAIKYNRDGGTVTVDCETTNTGTLYISVEDTGIGIPFENQSQLFEPFIRLGTGHEGIEGTGIGLTITRQIIEKMNGRVGFKSRPGEGSHFWFELPLAGNLESLETATDASPYATGTLEIAQKSKSILLYVEDDQSNLQLMQEVIGHFPNLTMLSAMTGEQGLDMAREMKPDIIFMDINLPGMDGYQAMNELHADNETKSIPVIALSAAAMPHDVSRGIEAGFFSYLTKPFNIDELLSTIDAALEMSDGGNA